MCFFREALSLKILAQDSRWHVNVFGAANEFGREPLLLVRLKPRRFPRFGPPSPDLIYLSFLREFSTRVSVFFPGFISFSLFDIPNYALFWIAYWLSYDYWRVLLITFVTCWQARANFSLKSYEFPIMLALSILRIFSRLSVLIWVSISKKPNCESCSRLKMTFFFYRVCTGVTELLPAWARFYCPRLKEPAPVCFMIDLV